jgi:hypothetical protein
MKKRFLTYCDDYRADPSLWVVHDEETLQYRYRNLQLRDSSELRLENLCADEQDALPETAGNGKGVD